MIVSDYNAARGSIYNVLKNIVTESLRCLYHD